MPTTAEYRINKGNAVALAKRSWELRRARKVAALAYPQPAQSIAQAQPTANPDLSKAIARTQAQLKRIDDALDDCTDPKAWDCLTRAKERLFRTWVHLAGIPGPGNRKPGPDRKREKPTGQTATVTIAPVQPPPPPTNPG